MDNLLEDKYPLNTHFKQIVKEKKKNTPPMKRA